MKLRFYSHSLSDASKTKLLICDQVVIEYFVKTISTDKYEFQNAPPSIEVYVI